MESEMEGWERAELISSSSTGKVTALDACKSRGPGDHILVYTPDFCGFVRLDGETLVRLEDGAEVPAADVFELRCFDEDSELRWVRENSDGGQAVMLSEAPTEEGSFYKRSEHYLLWGRGRAEGEVGARLFEYRIGTLAVPVEVHSGERVYLEFDEYFKPDEHGNMVWQTERLKGFSVE